MEPTNTQDSASPNEGDTVEVKKVETQNPATEIVINSEDGTISKPGDIDQNSSPSSEPVVESTQTTETVDAEKVEVQSSNESIPPVEDTASEATSQTSVETNLPQAENNPLSIPPSQQKKSGAPIAAIVVAILIALLLAGVGFVAYTKMNKSTTKNSVAQPQSAATTPEAKKTLTADDVKTTIKDIDTEANKTTGDTDMPTTDSVTDKSLGL